MGADQDAAFRATLTPPAKGLSEAEAHARLETDGPNELPRSGQRTGLGIFFDVIREPMFALLVAGGVIYLALGDTREALVLLVLTTLSIAITVVQESRSERALEALRDLASPRALVIRDGERQRIAGRDVVRGDMLLLAEGDRVAADAWVVEAQGLQADESLLTGESVPVRKSEAAMPFPAAAPRAGGDMLAFVYSGSLVVAGTALCSVAATGARSEIGRIGASLASLEVEAPHLYRQMRRLVLLFAAGGFTACLLAVLLHGLLRGDWLEGALAGIALGMSLLPEEFPVVLAVFMAMGAMRLSRVRVLARRAAAIETLGSTTVLCTDKTGTLTRNRMTLAGLRLPDGRAFDARPGGVLPADFWPLVELGVLASAPDPFDPMEIAFHEFARGSVAAGHKLRQDPGWDLELRYPLDPALLAVSHLWTRDKDPETKRLVAAKGAPEAVADLCRLDPAAREAIRTAANSMAAEGLRVLGVAEAQWTGKTPPASQRGFDFTFRGLVGLQDPLRPSVPDAVRQCRSAGIRVIMITGDYPETARAIAREAGLSEGEIVSGPMLAAMDDAALAAALARVTVFARIAPEQKLRIVEALKAAGEIVTMTGDGVNDAPSLKAAHIGVAMGGRGTDVAREAASIVLLDDDFGSMVTAIRVGRRIFDNLRKAMGFIVAVHVPIAGLALAPLLLGFPILLGPIHIALIEMIIDPVCSLVFEAETEEQGVMERPPRQRDSALMPRSLLVWSIAQGMIAFSALAALLIGAERAGVGGDDLRSLAVFGLIACVLMLVLVNRSFSASLVRAVLRPNIALAVVVTAVGLVLALAQFVAPVRALLSFGVLGAAEAAYIVLTAMIVFVLLETLKRLLRIGAGTRASSAVTSQPMQPVVSELPAER